MFLKNSNDHTTLVRTNNPTKKKKSVRGGHVIIEIMPPTIARHSEKGDDHSHGCFCFHFDTCLFFWVCLWYPTGITRDKNLPGYDMWDKVLQTTLPVWVLPSAGVPLLWEHPAPPGVLILTQNGSSSQNYFLRTVGWTCLHLDKLICKHCRDKNCCSFAVS
jgi:hypothetical protein